VPKYLIEASYTKEGVAGVAKEGGSGRVEAVRRVTESLGGSVEAFYFAFGDADVYTIIDLPDNEAAAAVALAVNGSGAVSTKTVVLLTPEQIDAAAKRSVEYRPPGG
jgi:uncharacterized protein with GYD domain